MQNQPLYKKITPFQAITVLVAIMAVYLYIALYEIEHQVYKVFKIDIDISNTDILALVSDNILVSTAIIFIIIGVISILFVYYALLFIYDKLALKFSSYVQKKIPPKHASFRIKILLAALPNPNLGSATIKNQIVSWGVMSCVLVFFITMAVSREVGKEKAYILQEKILNNTAEMITIKLNSTALSIHPLKCNSQICIGIYKLDHGENSEKQLFVTTFDARLYSKEIKGMQKKRGGIASFIAEIIEQ